MENIRYKTVIPRFGASLIDGALFLLLYLLIDTTTSYGDHYIAWVSTPIWLCYSVFFHGRFGQTPGKMVANVKVVDINDENNVIGFYKAVLRDIAWASVVLLETILHFVYQVNVETTVTMLSGAWMIAEIITLFSNPKQRAIHDFIASSVVINVKKTAELRNG